MSKALIETDNDIAYWLGEFRDAHDREPYSPDELIRWTEYYARSMAEQLRFQLELQDLEIDGAWPHNPKAD